MPSAIQTIKCIRDEIPLRTRILSLNTVVLSHLHYPCMLLTGCTEEKLEKLGKQTKMGHTNCHEHKHKRFCHICEGKQTIPTARYMIKYRSTKHLQKLSQKIIRAFNFRQFPISNFHFNHRTSSIFLPGLCKTDFLHSSFLFI